MDCAGICMTSHVSCRSPAARFRGPGTGRMCGQRRSSSQRSGTGQLERGFILSHPRTAPCGPAVESSNGEGLGGSGSGGAASFEGGEAFANVDRGPQVTIQPVDPGVDAVDPGVDPPDLRDKLGPERSHLGPERVDLDCQAGVNTVYLLVKADELLVQEADVA